MKLNKKARNHVARTGAGGAIKKDKRSDLSLPELGKLVGHATVPLTDKFTLMSLGDKEDQLSNAYNLTMSMVEMTKHFKMFDLPDVFYIDKTTVNATEGTLESVKSPDSCICWTTTRKSQ